MGVMILFYFLSHCLRYRNKLGGEGFNNEIKNPDFWLSMVIEISICQLKQVAEIKGSVQDFFKENIKIK